MKAILTVLLVLGLHNTALADDGKIAVGSYFSQHVNETSLNSIHPFISYETEDYGSIVYWNSFENTSLAVYGIDRWKINKNTSFVLRYGLVSGYEKTMTYKGEEYTVPQAPLVPNGLTLLAAPAIEYDEWKNGLVFQIQALGNAIAVGYKVSF